MTKNGKNVKNIRNDIWKMSQKVKNIKKMENLKKEHQKCTKLYVKTF